MEYGSTDSAGELIDNSTGIREGMMYTRDVCAGVVRTPSYKEIVRKNIDELSSNRQVPRAEIF